MQQLSQLFCIPRRQIFQSGLRQPNICLPRGGRFVQGAKMLARGFNVATHDGSAKSSSGTKFLVIR